LCEFLKKKKYVVFICSALLYFLRLPCRKHVSSRWKALQNTKLYWHENLQIRKCNRFSIERALTEPINITSQLIRRIRLVIKKIDSWLLQLPVLLIANGSLNPAADFTSSDWTCGTCNVRFMMSVSVLIYVSFLANVIKCLYQHYYFVTMMIYAALLPSMHDSFVNRTVYS
jgi:hypothetical protein